MWERIGMTQNKIALTGGIGSGKSTVSKILRESGYAVVSCDEVYAELIEGELKNPIAEKFPAVLGKDGKIDRELLAKTVFGDSEKINILNSLTHPIIMREALKRMCGELSFCEVPLLFEGNFQNLFDGVIVVRREREKRIDAVCGRSGLTREQVIMRIDAQTDYDNLSCDGIYVLTNDENLDKLKADTLKIVEKIKADFSIE